MSQCFAGLLSRDIVLRYESMVKLLMKLKFSIEKSEHAENHLLSFSKNFKFGVNTLMF